MDTIQQPGPEPRGSSISVDTHGNKQTPTPTCFIPFNASTSAISAADTPGGPPPPAPRSTVSTPIPSPSAASAAATNSPSCSHDGAWTWACIWAVGGASATAASAWLRRGGW